MNRIILWACLSAGFVASEGISAAMGGDFDSKMAFGMIAGAATALACHWWSERK